MDCDEARFNRCAEFSDRNPALLCHLASHIDDTAADNFCQERITEKFADEMWEEMSPAFAVFNTKDRKSLWDLVHGGILEEDFMRLSDGAWKKHLDPFALRYYSDDDGCYRWLLKSRPFQAFIESIFTEDGELRCCSLNRIPPLALETLVPAFNQVVQQFGETCYKYEKSENPIPSPRLDGAPYRPRKADVSEREGRLLVVSDRLRWFINNLPHHLQDEESFLKCDLVKHLLHECAHVHHQSIRDKLSNSRSLLRACLYMFIAARHCRCHMETGDDTSIIFRLFPVDRELAKQHLS